MTTIRHRMGRRSIGALCLAVAAAGMAALTCAAVPTAAVVPTAALVGAGLLQRLGCVGCVALVVYAALGTPLGVALLAWDAPEPVAACAVLCVIAAM